MSMTFGSISSLGAGEIKTISEQADSIGNKNGRIDNDTEYEFFQNKIDEGLKNKSISKEDYRKFLRREIRGKEWCIENLSKRLKTDIHRTPMVDMQKPDLAGVGLITLGSAGCIGSICKVLGGVSFKKAGIIGLAAGALVGTVSLIESAVNTRSDNKEIEKYKSEIEQLKTVYREQFGEEYQW